MFLTVALLAALGMATATAGDRVKHDIAAGYLKVDLIPDFPVDADQNSNVVVTCTQSVNDFRAPTEANTNRADFFVQIGDDSTDDVTNGVLIASVAQNGRNNYGSNNFHIATCYPLTSGAYQIGTFSVPVSSASSPSIEDNVDVAAAWFPYAGGWLGGMAFNSGGTNNAVLDTLVGSPTLQMGVNFIDLGALDADDNGIYSVDLRNLGISSTDGLLLVSGAKNENNFALSQPQTDGTWRVFNKDNRSDKANYEPDPVSFVYVPKSNTNVISGRFRGDRTIEMFSGSSAQFNLTASGNAVVLKIPGQGPATGILIISPCGGLGNNQDNIVTYQATAAGDGWTIGSRDLPGSGAYQAVGANAMVSFCFIPLQSPGFTVTPTNNLMTTESGGTATFTVTMNGYPKATSSVTVALSSSDTTEGTVSPSSLTFAPADWGVPKTVTVTGADDGLVDGTQLYNIVLAPAVSTDPNINGVNPPDVTVANADNEPGATVTSTSVTTTEAGGTATFEIFLNSAPTADVTLALSSSDGTEASVSPETLTFTPADYNTRQTVTVTGVDDFVVDGNVSYSIVTAPMSSADPVYNGLNPVDIAGVNLDNDSLGIVVSALPLTISEPNGTATFPVVLKSQPSANVTVNFSSTDTTEGTVTPSVTFTPSDWSAPKIVTVTAVDDLVDDGPQSFTILSSVTSTAPEYSQIDPSDVPVTTLDDEAAIRLPGGGLFYGLGAPAQGIDGYATITDANTADYAGGSLTVALSAGAISTDRLSVRHTGSGTGEIGVSGSSLSYEGVTIGTMSGGTGAAPLVFSLNSSATPAAAQALLRSVTYQNVDANAALGSRSVAVTLADGDGGISSTAATSISLRPYRVYTFQQAADGGFGTYLDAHDTQIHPDFPDRSFDSGYNVKGLWIDYNPDANVLTDQMQAFLKFSNLVGTNSGQIPTNAQIVYAELVMNVADSGHGARFNRMLSDWDEYVTFQMFGTSGVDLDNAEAVGGTNTFLGDQAHATTTGGGLRKVGCTADVQAWAYGTNNYGWVMSTWFEGDNGTAFSSCEDTEIMLRPKLRVAWMPAETAMATFQQGVNGYAGTADTQLHGVNSNTAYAGSTAISSDVLATGLQEPMLCFSNIIGSDPGQVPPYAHIFAAYLDLTSLTSSSQGDGGRLCAMLQPWSPTNTYNFWVDGITNDGVEAAVVQTADLGPSDTTKEPLRSTVNSFEVTSDVQAWATGTRPNYGWVIIPWPTGADGWGFNASEAGNIGTRPLLRVLYEPGVYVLNLTHNGTSVDVQFTGVIARTYTVQRASALGGAWSNLGTATVGSGGTVTYTDNSPSSNTAFYRVSYP